MAVAISWVRHNWFSPSLKGHDSGFCRFAGGNADLFYRVIFQ